MVVLDAVFHPLGPGGHDPGGGGGVVGRDGEHLGGDPGVQLDEHVAPVLGARHAHVEALVGLLRHEDVVGGVVAHAVSPQLEGAVGGVGPGVEDGGVVVGPRHPVRRAVDGIVEVAPGVEGAHPEGEPLGAGGVGGVQEPAVAGADRDVGHVQVGELAGERVLVQEDDLVGPRRRARRQERGRVRVTTRAVHGQAAVDGILGPLDGARVVPPRPFAYRHGLVGLHDAGPDLGEQLLAQTRQMGRVAFGEVVLGLEMGEHLRVLALAQPEPVVDAPVAVGLEDRRPPGGHGRRQGAGAGPLRGGPGVRSGYRGGRGHRRMIPDQARDGRTGPPGLLLSR